MMYSPQKKVLVSISTLGAEHLSKKFVHAFPGCAQGFPAKWRHFVNPPCNLSIALLVRAQIALALQPVQNRIKRSRTELVPMPGKFLGDPDSVERLLGGVVEDVQTDQP